MRTILRRGDALTWNPMLISPSLQNQDWYTATQFSQTPGHANASKQPLLTLATAAAHASVGQLPYKHPQQPSVNPWPSASSPSAMEQKEEEEGGDDDDEDQQRKVMRRGRARQKNNVVRRKRCIWRHGEGGSSRWDMRGAEGGARAKRRKA